MPRLSEAPAPRTLGSVSSAESLAAAAEPWPEANWWTRYGDPQLDALIREGMQASPTLAAARARIDRAEAAIGGTRAADLPQLSVTGSIAESQLSYYNGVPYAAVPKGVNEVASVRFGLDWSLDFFGRNRAALAAALSAAEAARAEAAQARLVLSTSIAATYSDLLGAMRDVDLARETMAVREHSARLVERRRAQGLETLASSAQAESAFESAQQALSAAGEQVQLTQLRLATLVGAGPDRGVSIQRPENPKLPAFGLPADLPAELLGRRPDLRAARLRVTVRAAQIRQARAGFYPSVNLSAFIGPQVLGLQNFFNDQSIAGSVGPAISLPIFRGGALRANLRGARADYDEAVASYDDVLLHALQEVAQATASERALAEQLRHARAARDAAQQAYNAVTTRYRGGLTNYINVLSVENTLITAKRAVSQLETRAFALDIALVRALGGGA